jgi:hypothetical protein
MAPGRPRGQAIEPVFKQVAIVDCGDSDGQDRLVGLLIGKHDDHVREVLGGRDLAHIRGAERAGDVGLTFRWGALSYR